MSVDPAITIADPILQRARLLWTELAGTPVVFPPAGGVDVAVSAGSRLCPHAWTGFVVLADAGIATAPDDATADLVREALGG